MIQLCVKEEVIAAKLREISPLPLNISWHQNSRSFLLYSKRANVLHLRLHRLFLDAPSPVLEALITSVLKKNKTASAIVRKMAHLYFSQTRIVPAPLTPSGNVYDLQLIYDELKGEFFSLQFDASIGWSDRARVKKFRSMTFGTYDRHRHQIRIHPLLDDPEVPLYFLRFLIYHEMLHAICPSIIDERGFCRSHTAEFRRLEKKFPDYVKAREWEKGSLEFFKKKFKQGRKYGRT